VKQFESCDNEAIDVKTNAESENSKQKT